MSWENTLLPASFRGIEFEVTATADDIERAVVIHEYPYVDGAKVEDMGRAPRRISMTAVYYGDDYEIQLQQLVKALDESGPGELIHPVFGSITAQFIRTSIPHAAELPDQSRGINLEFLESTVGTPLFDRVLPLQQVDAINEAADTVLDASKNRFIADIAQASSLPAMLRDKLSGDLLSVMGKMRGYCDQLLDARSWVASGLSYLNNPAAFVDDLSGGLVSRLDAIFSPMNLRIGGGGSTGTAYATGVAGTAVGATGYPMGAAAAAPSYGKGGAAVVASYAKGGLASVWAAPLAHLQQPLLPAATAPTQVSVAAASGDAAQVQPFLTAHIAIQQALVVTGAAAALFELVIDAPVLAPIEIETVAGDTRTTVNAAIALVRLTYPDIVVSRPITEPLKQLALAVSDAAERLIRARPPLRDRTVDTPGNLQLLAHLWYGDYRRADELLRLNPQVRNPNNVTFGTVLRAYAK